MACTLGHNICTLTVKDLVSGKPMKGPGVWSKGEAFQLFAKALEKQGLPIPTLAIWDPRRSKFIADLDTMDGQSEVASPELVAWVTARRKAFELGKKPPVWQGDKAKKACASVEDKPADNAPINDKPFDNESIDNEPVEDPKPKPRPKPPLEPEPVLPKIAPTKPTD